MSERVLTVHDVLEFAPRAATSQWSAADATTNGFTLSNGGVTYNNGSVIATIRGSVSKTAGKLYVEFLAVATGGNDTFGLANAGVDVTQQLGTSPISGGVAYGANKVTSGFTGNYTTTAYPSTGSVVALAVDFTAGSLWIAFNNVWVNGSNPATGTLPILSFVPATVGALFPAMQEDGLNNSWTLQPTAASQRYTPPAGFEAWDAPMSNGLPPIQPAPVPPSINGIPQPVYASGSPTAPTAASWFPQSPVGTWPPPPQFGMGGNAPFPTPPVLPGVGPTYQQPWYGSGSATVPPANGYFPQFTTTPPSPPIVFANIFMNGPGNPPQTVPPTFPIPPLPTSFMAEANEVAHEQRIASDHDRRVAAPKHGTHRSRRS